MLLTLLVREWFEAWHSYHSHEWGAARALVTAMIRYKPSYKPSYKHYGGDLSHESANESQGLAATPISTAAASVSAASTAGGRTSRATITGQYRYRCRVNGPCRGV